MINRIIVIILNVSWLILRNNIIETRLLTQRPEHSEPEFSTSVQRIGMCFSSCQFLTCNNVYNVYCDHTMFGNLSNRCHVGAVLRVACQRYCMFRGCLYKLYSKLSPNVRLTPIINIYIMNIKYAWDTWSQDNMMR